jgi:23S rRNA pseudouridine1911/1915/1917 synthase
MEEVAPAGALRIRVPEEAAFQRVDSWLASELSGVTRAAIQRWILAGRVLIDGRPCRPKDKLRPGTFLEVSPGEEPASDALPDPSVVLDVLFEDQSLLVVNKPAGLVVHPARGHRTGTLVNGLLARPGFERPAPDLRDVGGQLRPGIVHRIDKDTSGILVVAKTAAAREGLKVQLSAHTVEREYRALTFGVPREGRIETLHGRDPKNRLKFSSAVTTGKRAVTHVRVEERLAGGQAALVSCRLETGRTHQIRVHLSGDCGAPILADALYGGLSGRGRREQDAVLEVARTLGRQALHAGVLGFIHPETGQALRFQAPMPQDMLDAWARLRALP